MIWYVIGVLAIMALLVALAVWIGRPTPDVTEEKGPMPKRHGGFGQSVHGGK